MLEIVICEDNERVLSGLESMISKIIKENALQATIKFLASSVRDIENFIQYSSANFFILDIDLKSTTNGIDIAEQIRKQYKNAYIVFLTGHLEFVFQSFKVRPFNYLAKPISFEILEKQILDVYSSYIEDYNATFKSQDYLEIKSLGVLYRVKLCDIILLERLKSKSIIHLVDGQIGCAQTLSDIQKMLNDKRFIRCHKSFICNKEHVAEFRIPKSEIFLKNGLTCSIGRQYKKGLIEGV